MKNISIEEMSMVPLDPKDFSDRSLLEAVYRFIAELKHNADLVTQSIVLDTRTVKQLLQISERTVCRWRENGTIRYHVRPDNSLYYQFDELLADVKSGHTKGRNFDRIETLQRLMLYRNGMVKGMYNHDWNEEYAE